MKRRQFLATVSAASLAPALPAMPTAAAAAPAAAFNDYMFGLGAHMARTKGAVSVASLMQKLRLSAPAAQAMHAQLIAQGIVTPTAAGVAFAKPYMQGAIRGSTSATLAKAQDVARKALQNAMEPGSDGKGDSDDPSFLPESDPGQSLQQG